MITYMKAYMIINVFTIALINNIRNGLYEHTAKT